MSVVDSKAKNDPLQDDEYASLPKWVRLWAFKGQFGDSKWKWVLLIVLLVLMPIARFKSRMEVASKPFSKKIEIALSKTSFSLNSRFLAIACSYGVSVNRRCRR